MAIDDSAAAKRNPKEWVRENPPSPLPWTQGSRRAPSRLARFKPAVRQTTFAVAVAGAAALGILLTTVARIAFRDGVTLTELGDLASFAALLPLAYAVFRAGAVGSELERIARVRANWEMVTIASGLPAGLGRARALAELTDDGEDVSGIVCAGAWLPGLSLDGARLVGATFEHAVLEEARLLNSSLNNASFAHAQLVGARLENCRLVGADFSRADARGASFVSSWLLGARFEETELVQADFTLCMASGAVFRSMNLMFCDFTRAALTMALFEDVALGQVDFTGADLSHAVFINAMYFEHVKSWRGAFIRDATLSADARALAIAGGALEDRDAFLLFTQQHPAPPVLRARAHSAGTRRNDR